MSAPPQKPDGGGNAPNSQEDDISAVTEVIRAKIKDIIPRSQAEQVATRVASVVSQYKGPIPSAGQFADYEAVLPGSADRILRMAEENNAHNISAEGRQLQADIEDRRRGMIFGFIALLCLIGAACYFGAVGKVYLASGFIAVGVVASTVGVFVQGRQ
jgi:uncharacterized membrane protein